MTNDPTKQIERPKEAHHGLTAPGAFVTHLGRSCLENVMGEHTRRIPLTKGYHAIVDAEDYEAIANHKWHLKPWRNKRYAARTSKDEAGKHHQVLMHRAIMDIPEGMEVDHINGDGLDNRKDNMRTATRQQNQRNMKPHSDSQAPYKGITWSKVRNKWVAQIWVNGKQLNLGGYRDPKEAALAYDTAAREYFGEFACCNFEEDTDD